MSMVLRLVGYFILHVDNPSELNFEYQFHCINVSAAIEQKEEEDDEEESLVTDVYYKQFINGNRG